jgi:hypothetical protein
MAFVAVLATMSVVIRDRDRTAYLRAGPGCLALACHVK